MSKVLSIVDSKSDVDIDMDRLIPIRRQIHWLSAVCGSITWRLDADNDRPVVLFAFDDQ